MWKRKRWSRRIQVQFFETLGDLIDSGYGLKEALAVLEKIVPKQQGDIQAISVQLNQGSTMASAIQPYVSKVILMQLSLVQLHGNLKGVLSEIGKHEYERSQQIQQCQGLLVYPAILLTMVVGMGIFMARFLMPQMVSLTGEPTVKHHLSTMEMVVIVLGASVSVVIIGLAIPYMVRLSVFERFLWLMKIPGISRGLQSLMGYYICLHLGLLLQSGVSMSTVVQRLAGINQRTLVGNLASKAQNALEGGHDVCGFVRNMPLLPNECEVLFQVGKPQEAVGRDMERLSRHKLDEFNRLVQRGLTMIQPVAFCIIGGLVIYMYAKMLLPMYSSMGKVESW